MSWPHQDLSRRRTLTAATGLAAGALLPPTAAPGTVSPQGPALATTAAFTNPVIWQDFADTDVTRVGDTYYASASTMHYSPGAPALRSYDLVNWEVANHSVSVLDFGAKYDLNGARGYVPGIWASSLAYRPSNRTFCWLGQIDFTRTYVYTATAVEGPRSRLTTIGTPYYDAGLLVDTDDTLYVAYGNTTISVAQLSPDGRNQVRTQQVFTAPSSVGTLEGSRFYKVDGQYYIFLTRPKNGQYILKSSSGAWYYMAFVDAYPGGRMPALAPVTWAPDGRPVLQLVNGAWGTSYPSPAVPTPPRQVTPMIGVDTFDGTALKPRREWNHNLDNAKWSVDNGPTLRTATVTNDLYWARNTLTHRIQGPTPTATVQLDHTAMRDGDRAGLALLRDSSAWIGVKRDGGTTRLVMVNGLAMEGNWKTTDTGTEVASATLSGSRVWLRANADIRPGRGRPGAFSYSTDGTTFTRLGPAFSLGNDWRNFMGHSTDRTTQPTPHPPHKENYEPAETARLSPILSPGTAGRDRPGDTRDRDRRVRRRPGLHPGRPSGPVRTVLRNRRRRRPARRRHVHRHPGP
ncbi:glycoside hydrolase family 43 protein [Streptomyces mirabilis]|uniref:glycoside hydrolase family 43 protein n=1 Tax=Streptomyces mirabilis TaxID=68239 RepID=UPI0036D85A67